MLKARENIKRECRMIYNLIETTTGRNHSQSSTPIPGTKVGYHVVETADNIGVSTTI